MTGTLKRFYLMLAVVAGGAQPLSAWAVEQLRLTAEQVSGHGQSARQVSLLVDLRRGAALELRAGSADLGPALGKYTAVHVRSAEPQIGTPAMRLPDLQVTAVGGPLGKLQFSADVAVRSDTGALQLRALGQPLAAGRLELDLRSGSTPRDPTAWQLQANFSGATLPGLRALAARWLKVPADLTIEGKLDGTAQFAGHAKSAAPPFDQGEFTLQGKEVNFNNEAGTTVGENITATLQGTAQSQNGVLLLTSTIKSNSGQALSGPVLLDLKANPLRVTLQGLLDGQNLNLQQITLAQQDLSVARGNAQLQMGDSITIKHALLTLEQLQFPAAYAAYLQIAAAATTFGTLETQGSATGEFEVTDNALTRADMSLHDVTLNDTRKKFAMSKIVGELHWRPAGVAVPLSHLAWSDGAAYGLSGGASRVNFRAAGAGFTLSEAVRIPIFDGALAIRALEASGLGSTDPQVHFEADIAPISMSHLSSAFGWPKLFGQFSGHIPRVDYRNKVVSVTGDVEARVFDGRIIGSKIRLQDPLGPWPRFFADVLAEDLDLELVTRAFEFGTITGRLGGRLGNLELFNWSPVAFDAALQTPDGDRSKHRISARAVGNLANIGGGGGGVLKALQSGTMKFFDEYSYDRIGIGCGLRNDVCRMSGVEVAADGRYFILKGKGLPHINIIGSANRVNWPRLLSQITAQMSGSGTVRIE